MKVEDLVGILNRLYPSTPWPKPFNLLRGRRLFESGKEVSTAAREVGTTAARLKKFCDVPSPLTEIFGVEEPDDRARKDARQILGNLIVGQCAELTFEEMYKTHMRPRSWSFGTFVRVGPTQTIDSSMAGAGPSIG